LRRLLQVERPAVVHCHGSKAALVGRVAAWGLPVCTVYTVHGELGRSHSGAVAWAKRGVERVLAGMTDRFVAVSPTVARELRTRFNVPVGKLTVLPNAVDAGQFELSQQEQDEAREWLCGKLSLSCPAHIVGSVARLAPEKGLDTAVRALAALPKVRGFTAREPVLVVAGEGPERQELQQLAQALGVAECVHLLGHVEDVPRFLGALDAFVLPSRSEGQSIALLEAMAANLPIAASRVGGIPDVLTHEIDGLLVPPEDPEALASAVVELQAGTGAALGVRARQTVEHLYSWPEVVAGLEAIYQELVEQLTR
jgi:glycosyltransferase involved in cell wall biosynthesis